jgi:Kef-type K+ transport system membrane component KefB
VHAPLLTSVLLVLVLSRLFGELANRSGQPVIVGEILAGILLGPSVLGMVEPTTQLSGIAELGAFLVVMSAGLEMDFGDVLGAFRKSFVISIFGFLVPLGAGFGLGWALGFGIGQTVFLGLCFSITALPIAAKMLSNFNILDTPMGHSIIGAAILIDLAALLSLGIILDATSKSEFAHIAESAVLTGGKMLGFFGGVIALDLFLRWRPSYSRRARRVLEGLLDRFGQETLFGLAVLFTLACSSLTEALGLHYVIGAFFGGLLLNRDITGAKLFGSFEKTLHAVSDGFLAPVFFAFIGLQFDLTSLASPWLVSSIIVVGFAAKALGSWLGTRLAGGTAAVSLGTAFIMNARGVMDLVVADIALKRGFIGKELFSTLVLLGILATVLAPLLYRLMAKITGVQPETAAKAKA